MRPPRFDRITRSFSPSRRALVGVALTALAGQVVPATAGAKKRKRRKPSREGRPNQFGCRSTGQSCKSARQCCSSICQGKRGKRTCRAHHTGTCDQSLDGICKTPEPAAISCNGSMDCGCGRSTAGTNVCFAYSTTGDYCAGCRTDADCEAAGYPAGAVCLDMTEGVCDGNCASGTACFAPCGTEMPGTEP